MNVLALPGDGIGPEVMEVAISILKAIEKKAEVIVELIGGASIDKRGVPISDDVLRLAKKADAVLLGAVGGPKWDDLPVSKRPEAGLLALRKEMDVWANIRPIKIFDPLKDISPLKNARGVDFIILRELTGDVYFGEPRKIEKNKAYNTMIYRREEVERIAELAFELARKRRKKVVSVDKANVLETSMFWRQVVSEVAKNYPDVEVQHQYVDSCALKIITDPGMFDVILCPNLFGDILSDEAGGILGSLGLCPSASIGKKNISARTKQENINGLYEPIHGSAPDIAGRGIANPIGMILSVAMMLEYSFGKKNEAEIIEKAVERTLEEGYRTPDISNSAEDKVVGTKKMGEIILKKILEI